MKVISFILTLILTWVMMIVTTLLGAFTWTWYTMLVVGAAKPYWGWGYWHTMFPYGIVVAMIVALFANNNSEVKVK